jgi:hypothetical protein
MRALVIILALVFGIAEWAWTAEDLPTFCDRLAGSNLVGREVKVYVVFGQRSEIFEGVVRTVTHQHMTIQVGSSADKIEPLYEGGKIVASDRGWTHLNCDHVVAVTITK